MNHGIYKGSIVQFIVISPKVVCFKLDGDEISVGLDHIVGISDDEYQKVEAEMKAAKEEVIAIRDRMHKLDEAYEAKKEGLRELYLTARQKEQSIVDKVLKSIKENDKNNLIDTK